MNDINYLREKYTPSQSHQLSLTPLTSDSISFDNTLWFIVENKSKFRKRGKNEPAKRWGHTAVIKDNKMMINGGAGLGPKNARHWQCFYQLDLLDWEWSKLEPGNNPPPARDSHTAVLFEDGIYIYGGSGGIIKQNNEFYKFDLTTYCWERISAEGNQPPGREGHTASIVYDKYMVIYGGWESNQDVLTDTYVYDFENNKWSLVIKKSGPSPKPRESQGSCAIGDYIYIFGGQGNDQEIDDYNYEVYLNDLYRFKLEIDGDRIYSLWEELKPIGTKPSKRSSPSACAYKNRFFFIIGGEGYPKEFDEESPLGANPKKQRDVLKKHRISEDGSILSFPKSDVWFYDTYLNMWNRLNIKNHNLFLPRFAHTSCVFEDYIFIFGGLSSENNEPHDDIVILSLKGSDPFKLTHSLKKLKSASAEDVPGLKSSVKNQVSSCKNCKNRIRYYENDVAPTYPSLDKKDEADVRIKLSMEESPKNGPIVTGAYLHMLSELIGWPFAALGLLIDNSTIREASNLKIELVTKKPRKRSLNKVSRLSDHFDLERNQSEKSDFPNEQEETDYSLTNLPLAYLELVDDSRSWTPEEFVDMIADFDTTSDGDLPPSSRHATYTTLSHDKKEEQKDEKVDEHVLSMNKRYSVNLRIGGLRLGNSIVVFSKTNNYSLLGYISIQKMTDLHLPCNKSFLYSCWENSTGVYRTIDGEKTRKLIMSEIEGFVSESELETMAKSTGTKVLILNLKKLPIFKKGSSKISFEYELTSVTNSNEELVDINIRTLDQELKKNLGLTLSLSMIEFSLKTYLSVFFLEESPIKTKRSCLELFLFGKKVEMINVKKTMEQIRDEDEKLFVEFIKPKMFEGLVGCRPEWKEMKKDDQHSQEKTPNNSILVYYNNRLVKRLESTKLGYTDYLATALRLGKKDLYDQTGFVSLMKLFKPNITMTEIENGFHSNYAYSVISDILSGIRSRQSEITIEDKEELDEKANTAKKVKRS